jgi:hypothetical protein
MVVRISPPTIAELIEEELPSTQEEFQIILNQYSVRT